MKKSDFIKLHLNLSIRLPHTKEFNPLLSATDPTQDIPIKAIQITATGVPINVKEFKQVFSNVRIEDFSTIEKRNCDQFDNLGELQNSVAHVARKGVKTNYIKPKGKKLKNPNNNE